MHVKHWGVTQHVRLLIRLAMIRVMMGVMCFPSAVMPTPMHIWVALIRLREPKGRGDPAEVGG